MSDEYLRDCPCLVMEALHPSKQGPETLQAEQARFTPPPILQLRAVHKRFRSGRSESHVLRGGELTLRQGEVVALVGPSGAGKTTLLQILAGLLSADSGEAWFLGNVLPLEETCRARHRMSLVLQDPYAALPSHMPVRRIVSEPVRIRSRKDVLDSRLCEVLSSVHLAPPELYLDRYPAQLSGGQRQRVAIARAIITAPELLLADEPTSMLDASAGVGILNLFRDLAQRGMSILVTIHDLATACYVADRILVFFDGSVVEEGTSAEILNNPRHDLTRNLLEAAGMRDLRTVSRSSSFRFPTGAG